MLKDRRLKEHLLIPQRCR